MGPDLWQRVEEVYYQVVACPPERRPDALNDACGSDLEVRREVESLLAARSEAAGFLSDLFSQTARLSSAGAELSVGRRLGHYEILGAIGAGAMGEVFRARDTRLGREVALKILHPHLTHDDTRVSRFRFEAKAASALNHPNIPTTYDIGEENGLWLIASELVEGVTLRERLVQGPIPLEDAIRITLQCAAALEAAHRAGIVHRDIKPENLMLRSDGVVKVVDFGLARMLDGEDLAAGLTQSGSVMGTPRYMSPEQARGQKSDARSDIFSLGAVLYEMIAGRPAFPGSTAAEIFVALLEREPLPTNSSVDVVLAKALLKDRAKRYQTGGEFANDLRNLPNVKRSRPSLLPLRALQSVAAVSLLALAGFASYTSIARRRSSPVASLKFTVLTKFGGPKQHPAFSPDSLRIAFSWKAPDQESHHIYVKPLAGGEPAQLTSGSEEDAFPVWSPDSRQLAFCRRAVTADERAPVRSAVWIMPAAGSPPSQITEGCEGLSWSPDGKDLAVARVPGRLPDSGGIDLLSLASGKRRTLTRSREDLLPVYSPDGMFVAFIRVLTGRGRGREIFVVPTSGGQPRQLTFDGEYISGVTWTADSREIVFSSPRDAAQGSFWRIPVSGGSPLPLSAALRSGCFPSISRQGGQMAYIDCATDSNIYLRTGGGFPRPGMPWKWDAPRGVALSTGSDHTPIFSPDGERFAFVSDRYGNNRIWVSRRDGSEATQVSSLPTQSSGSPRWSPDGAWIACDVWAANQSHVYLVSSRGGPMRRLSSEPGESWNPAWSPDGKWVYFTSGRSGIREIWKAPSAGGASIQVTHNGAFEGRPSLDGKTVYFRKSTPSGCCAIWSVPAGGGREEPLPELERIPNISRSWDVLPQGIYFVARETGPRQTARFLDFATRQVTDIASLDKDPDWSFAGLALSPDGRSLLTVQVDREVSDLVLMENFR